MYVGPYKDQQELQAEKAIQDSHNLYQELKNYHYRSIHNIIFAIGTGTFVLSISFIGNLSSPLEIPLVLVASWFLLVCSIVLKIYSHQLAQHIASLCQTVLEEHIMKGYSNPNFNVNNPTSPEIEKLEKKRGEVDNLTLIFIGFGIFALLLFASANLLAQNIVAGKQTYHHEYRQR